MSKDKREVMEYPVELESQFVLRLPEEPARVLRDILRSGESLRSRLTIQLEPDLRHGEVRLDHRLMHAKIVDMPGIIESLKTIDNKSFYKTADVCQMMICRDEPEQPAEEEAPGKPKKKDPYKVDKKFLWPHGIAPPAKNVRKRRFRKTLKKKYVEAPEIEKEVKRLLRADNEAVNVTWEVLAEEETKAEPKPHIKPERDSSVVDIFGGALSDSEEEYELSDSNSALEPGGPAQPDVFPSRLATELEELRARRRRTQHEIASMENQALRQRFQDVLTTLNQDILYKEAQYAQLHHS